MNIETDNERDCGTHVCARAGEHTHGHTCCARKLMRALVFAKFCFLLVRHKKDDIFDFVSWISSLKYLIYKTLIKNEKITTVVKVVGCLLYCYKS